MNKKVKNWCIKEVSLVPYKIEKEREELLLSELARIFYDLSCQFRDESASAKEQHLAGLNNRRSGSE